MLTVCTASAVWFLPETWTDDIQFTLFRDFNHTLSFFSPSFSRNRNPTYSHQITSISLPPVHPKAPIITKPASLSPLYQSHWPCCKSHWLGSFYNSFSEKVIWFPYLSMEHEVDTIYSTTSELTKPSVLAKLEMTGSSIVPVTHSDSKGCSPCMFCSQNKWFKSALASPVNINSNPTVQFEYSSLLTAEIVFNATLVLKMLSQITACAKIFAVIKWQESVLLES